MKVSVVLPTYNRLPRLKKVIAGLEKQTFPFERFEVVVVSDGSSDGTNEFLTTLQTPLQLRPQFQENQGVAVTRNHGIEKAENELIVFIDDDVVPHPELIAEHVHIHETEGNDVIVVGPMLTPPDFSLDPWTRWMQIQLVKQYDDMLAGAWEPTARQFYTGNASILRCHLLESGGFDPSFLRAEDVELAYRLAEHGLRFLFHPGAIGYHYEERSFQSWIKIPYAYGRNDVIMTRQKGQSWLLPKIFTEFYDRHPIVRGITAVCLDRPVLSKLATAGFRQLLHLNGPFMRLAGSSLFNLYHYQGIADELGGRDKFFESVAEAAPHQ